MKPVTRTLIGSALLLAVCLSAQEAPKPVAFKVSAQTFLKPAKWVAQKTASRMRAAQFGVPGEKGKEGDQWHGTKGVGVGLNWAWQGGDGHVG